MSVKFPCVCVCLCYSAVDCVWKERSIVLAPRGGGGWRCTGKDEKWKLNNNNNRKNERNGEKIQPERSEDGNGMEGAQNCYERRKVRGKVEKRARILRPTDVFRKTKASERLRGRMGRRQAEEDEKKLTAPTWSLLAGPLPERQERAGERDRWKWLEKGKGTGPKSWAAERVPHEKVGSHRKPGHTMDARNLFFHSRRMKGVIGRKEKYISLYFFFLLQRRFEAL